MMSIDVIATAVISALAGMTLATCGFVVFVDQGMGIITFFLALLIWIWAITRSAGLDKFLFAVRDTRCRACKRIIRHTENES